MLRRGLILLAFCGTACTPAPPERQLDVSLLFHFNQDLVPKAPMAAAVQYEPLLKTLLNEEVPFQAQVSGTLLNALIWFDRGVVDYLRQGGYFDLVEIWGSTYSQNILAATGSRVTNDAQILTHRRLLDHHFRVTPQGFWNPERVWTRDLPDYLSGHGYDYVPVETHILQTSGYTDSLHVVRPARGDSASILVIHDDTAFKHLFNQAVNSGSTDSLLSYLRALYQEDTADRYLVAYFEDAEASGLWQFEAGGNPEETLGRLRTVLRTLADQDWIRITTTEAFLSGHDIAEEPMDIGPGAANWMNEFSASLGFEDWYDYAARDSATAYFRSLVEPVRAELAAADAALPPGDSPARRLFDRAMRTYLAHEYEYGASWTWDEGWADFHFAREARISLLASRHASGPTYQAYQQDLTGDGVQEVVIVRPEQMLVWTPLGGRLQYWFDLRTGDSVVGNENFGDYFERYQFNHTYQREWQGGEDVYRWAADNPHAAEVLGTTFKARTPAFADRLLAGSRIDSLQNATFRVEGLTPDGVTFVEPVGTGALQKTVSVDENRVRVGYSLAGLQAELEIEVGLSPGYVEIMDRGASILTVQHIPDGLQVMNQVTGRGAEVRMPPGAALRSEQTVFGHTLRATVRPEQPVRVILRLISDSD